MSLDPSGAGGKMESTSVPADGVPRREDEVSMDRRYVRMLIRVVIGLAILPGSLPAAQEPLSRTFDAGGVRIHFLVQGVGEPVVLIHGLHSSTDINWRMTGIFGDLARDHRVIAIDLPGHGRSDRPDKDEAYGLRLVEDVILLLDHLKIERSHVVGYSVGGMVALKLVTRHPERVLSATIGGMGWFRDGSPLQNIWDQMPARSGVRTPPAFIRGVSKLALTEDELKKIDVPVEILVGDRDPVKRRYVAPLRPKRRDWPVIEIEDAGHIDCIVKKQFRQELAGWLRRQSGKATG
jgi:pimeloyl-ACP methyl ester carboxylesterase